MVYGQSMYRMTAQPLEESISCIRARCEIRFSELWLQTRIAVFSDKPFMCAYTHNLKTTGYTRAKNFLVKLKCKQGWACKKHRNKKGMKIQQGYPAAEKWW